MSIGGELFLACDGEDLLKERFVCGMTDGKPTGCALTSHDVELGHAPTLYDSLQALRDEAARRRWSILLIDKREYAPELWGRELDLCPHCSEIWRSTMTDRIRDWLSALGYGEKTS